MIMNLIDRWVSFGQNKFNEVGATATSGAMVANGINDHFTLSEWSTILGMIYVLSMLIPRLIELVKWLYSKFKVKK